MSAGKECSGCGAKNDVIFTTCMFCKSPLPELNIESISTDDLLMNAGEWVGKSLESYILVKGPNANELTGKDIKRMESGEIVGNAEKYLSLLKIRATNNSTLMIEVQSLVDKLEKNQSKSKSKRKKTLIGLASIAIILFTFIGIMAFFESSGGAKEQERLDNVELQINGAIKEKNYDYALILAESLTWNYEVNKNEALVEQYIDKKNGYKDSIRPMKDKENNPK